MIKNKEVALKVAEYLLEIKAIKLNPKELFTWASGIQSPIYCDNRISLAYPEVRSFIKKSFSELALQNFPEANLIAGVATAGIAHGALLADNLNMPFCYVRAKAKEHGTKSMIEGRLQKGDKVVVVEDLFSTGGSALKAIQSLQEEGAEVLGVLAIFNYGFAKVDKAFAEISMPFYTLSNFESLLSLLKDNPNFSKADLSYMEKWYKEME
ncbi:MAG: orotate phosphoribosyltransferase [Chitinophagales bacterium]